MPVNRLYRTTCTRPKCSTNGLIVVDRLGRTCVECPRHGLVILRRRQPSESERLTTVRPGYNATPKLVYA